MLNQNNLPRQDNNDLRDQMPTFEKRMREVGIVLHCLSVEDIMRTFELYIVVEILGSKKDIRRYSIYSVKDIINSSSQDVQRKYEKSRWYGRDDIFSLVKYFKNCSRMLVHSEGVNYTDIGKKDLIAAVQKHELDQIEQDIIILIANELESFCKAHGQKYGNHAFL